MCMSEHFLPYIWHPSRFKNVCIILYNNRKSWLHWSPNFILINSVVYMTKYYYEIDNKTNDKTPDNEYPKNKPWQTHYWGHIRHMHIYMYVHK